MACSLRVVACDWLNLPMAEKAKAWPQLARSIPFLILDACRDRPSVDADPATTFAPAWRPSSTGTPRKARPE